MVSRKILFGSFACLVVACIGFFLYTKTQGESIRENNSLKKVTVESHSISQNPVRVPIFIYHSIRPDDPTLPKSAKIFDTTPEILEQELKYLKDNGYTTISLDELVATLHAGTLRDGQKPVVLTFDDGLENQYTYAYPLLKKYNAKATFFVYPNPIEHNDLRFMSWDHVKEIGSTPGLVIGNHTLTHPLLSKLTPEELHHEVIDSKKILETKLGKPVTHFAAPFGYTGPELVQLLKNSGYATGRTTTKGPVHTSDTLYALTAYMPHNTLYDFTWSLEH